MEWRKLFKQNFLKGAQEYADAGEVHDLSNFDGHLCGTVAGVENFHVDITVDENDQVRDMRCTCPYAQAGNNCKHMAAVLLAWEKMADHTGQAQAGMPPADDPALQEIIPNLKMTGQKTHPAETDGEDRKQAARPVRPSEAITGDSAQIGKTAEKPAESGTFAETVCEPAQETSAENPALTLECDIESVISFAAVHNGDGFIRNICLKNIGSENLDSLTVEVRSDSDLVHPYSVQIDRIAASQEQDIRSPQLTIDVPYLASMTERSTAQISVRVLQNDKCLCVQITRVTVLAFDEWPGLTYTPELLTAFSLPNSPAVISLLALSAKYLEKWTGDPALAGYQYGDPNRVRDMAAAAYAAIQEKNIIYAEPPASFEAIGQRIRLADTVLTQHFGTCMDLTLLYCACLEAMGLNPMMIMMKGHIFAGVWLEDESFSEMLQMDPGQLEKRMSTGINEILVVECTAMCAGRTRSFDEAAVAAEHNVSDHSHFVFALDVKRARSMGIRPLPVRVKADGAFEAEHEDRKEDQVTGASAKKVEAFDLDQMPFKENVTKVIQWQRKLLDLGLSNTLINMRMTQAVVPLLSPDVSTLEDSLSDGEEFQVLPRPADMQIKGADQGVPIEMLSELGPFQNMIELESTHHRLHSLYMDKQLEGSLKKIYRSAKKAMEESGASTLYLVLGVLRWFEKKGRSKEVARYAPIVLVPIEMIRKSASQGYTMRMRDEDAQINITLTEFLKQNYDLRIPGLALPPEDEHGLDIPKIFAIVRHAVMDFSMWDVVEAGFIGNFSFTQFVMWRDIQNEDFLNGSKIVHSLIQGAMDWEEHTMESSGRTIAREDNRDGMPELKSPENVEPSGSLRSKRAENEKAPETSGCASSGHGSFDEAYLPVTVDSSQLRAINLAAEGNSFVLYGPPGTGKSQTITAMIANALTKGETVLFVAEKMAALEVVQKRLNALGIEDFCLELHSNKATKKAVLDQLQKNLEFGVQGSRTDYDEKIKDVRAMQADLDAYAEALHARRPFGRNLRELIDLYELTRIGGQDDQTEPALSFDHSYVIGLTENNLDHQLQDLERLVAAGREIGHPHDHPLQMVHKEVYSQTIRFEMRPVLETYEDSLCLLKKAAAKFLVLFCPLQPAGNVKPELSSAGSFRYETEFPDTREAWTNVFANAEHFLALEQIPSFLLDGESVRKMLPAVETFFVEKEKYEAERNKLLIRWKEPFLAIDTDGFQARYEQAGKKFFGKGKALLALTQELQAYALFTVETEQIPVYMADLAHYQQQEKSFEQAQTAVPMPWREFLKSYQAYDELKPYLDETGRAVASVESFAGAGLQGYLAHIKNTNMSEGLAGQEWLSSGSQRANRTSVEFEKNLLRPGLLAAKELLAARAQMQEHEQAAAELLGIHFAEYTEHPVTQRLEVCEQVIENADSIKDWITYERQERKCRAQGLGPVCDAYLAGLAHDLVVPVYEHSIYKEIILAVIETEPVLNEFTGTQFNEKIEQFKKLDREFEELTKREMLYRLTNNIPRDSESIQVSRELNILRRAIRSNGRGLSIRSLFEQIPHILRRLCPCMLMSPISVAQYLKPENDLFDIVIFDEASQMPTSEAVGVLARGKNAVICGDPNQMPPTSFFSGNVIDEDNLELEDLDSILDDCLALGMPQTKLQWHYRSRYESLIAFSNEEFYENSMRTFPAVDELEKRVSLVKTEGFFDRGKRRVNAGEAQAVVEEILRRYRDPVLKKQSIGVVTFNTAQQELVEDLLAAECEKDDQLDAWVNHSDEPVFIKNLENVQGDERDVILFSIAYGPDAQGKLLLNFGPLNKDGGWKRLNVAVTRARSEMVVFTVMTPDMIDLRRTKAKGIEALKDFLEFAQDGELPQIAAQKIDHSHQGILLEICKALDESGFTYQTDIGHSKFKVDIAIINPYDPEKYLLGILLDGPSYYNITDTRDREIGQVNMLHTLGWKLQRIWTMDWWDHRDRVMNRLLQTLEEKKQAAQTEAARQKSAENANADTQQGQKPAVETI